MDQFIALLFSEIWRDDTRGAFDKPDNRKLASPDGLRRQPGFLAVGAVRRVHLLRDNARLLNFAACSNSFCPSPLDISLKRNRRFELAGVEEPLQHGLALDLRVFRKS
ncbi:MULTISPECIES: hypothetical protein [Bradyrhizobium]|uniref:hypothetical protein n=1 Tax=Bradyrhizobium TaxID=374 RepID=UPI0012BD3C6A|nr:MULTISPECIES: hypothetical protein [Bradyrhizobium]MCS3452270.1 hypothetical protein [Bradyrhizobium elkanii]MCS3565628.1 hypothetical protein [Bradyrhizobium elkanii]MCW2153640.1 hypothetical protein [Bradyrhizobium elkanii]MCW2356667.1 hypothetical protein [Bradyrhizobium elkanii]MCW2377371.1 hypothetical protein [Bradyrhizobium elkanii]